MSHTQDHSKPSRDSGECPAGCWPLRPQYIPPDMAVSRPMCWLGCLCWSESPCSLLLKYPERVQVSQVPRKRHPPVAMEWEVSVWIVSGFLSSWLTATLVVGCSPNLGRWFRCWDAPQTQIPLY